MERKSFVCVCLNYNMYIMIRVLKRDIIAYKQWINIQLQNSNNKKREQQGYFCRANFHSGFRNHNVLLTTERCFKQLHGHEKCWQNDISIKWQHSLIPNNIQLNKWCYNPLRCIKRDGFDVQTCEHKHFTHGNVVPTL